MMCRAGPLLQLGNAEPRRQDGGDGKDRRMPNGADVCLNQTFTEFFLV